MAPITQRFLTVLVSVLSAVAAGFLIEALLSIKTGWQYGHTQKGHLIGWAGFVTILAVFGYTIKKRFGRKTGWPKGWFLVHKAAGIIGPMMILIHAGAHFHALVPFFALMSMGIVVFSGIIGVMVHRKAIGMLNATRKELLSQGLSREDVDARLFDLASHEERFRIWQVIHTPMVVIFIVLAIVHIVGAIYFGGL